jgi:hypothetical protein
VTDGKSQAAIYYLGTGTSFNVTSKTSSYGSLTINNFIVGVNTVTTGGYNGWWNDDNDNCFIASSGTISKSYNPSTGVLSCSFSGTVYVNERGVSEQAHSTPMSGTCFAYLVTGSIS